MSKMVQIRNVPDALHRKLKVRAATSGQTLSDYLLAELVRLAARPTREEMLARIHSRKRVTLKTPAAVVIREERESACRQHVKGLRRAQAASRAVPATSHPQPRVCVSSAATSRNRRISSVVL